MEVDDQITFQCIEDERNYWKKRAATYYKDLTDVKQEYEEFVDQSRQMEVELDATLEQKQSLIKDLKVKNFQLVKENEFLKNKAEGQLLDLSNAEKQLDTLLLERDALKVYSRQLEQKNDDLERAHRILDESIRDFERMLDKAYEKNAILELEVDEKEVLQEKLQRLMDETRDLKQELNLKTRFSHDPPTAIDLNKVNVLQSTNDDTETKYLNNVISINNSELQKNRLSHQQENAQQQQQSQSLTLKNSKCTFNGNAINASSRNTALNIVADMLRKLNAMESKLNKYREHQHPRQ